jgi:hypothetical protein
VSGLRPVNGRMPMGVSPFFLEKHIRTTYNEKSLKTAH